MTNLSLYGTPLLYGVLFLISLVIIWRKVKSNGPLKSRIQLSGESGQAMTETAISFPIVLLLVFAIMQLSLLYTARIVVHYGSYLAARTAIVWIPFESEDGESVKNRITLDGDDPKLQRIRSAAMYALIPISGNVMNAFNLNASIDLPDELDFLQGSADDLIGSLGINDIIGGLGDLVGGFLPENSVTSFLSKIGYAYLFSYIELMEEDGVTPLDMTSGDDYDYSETAPVTVRVNFYYPLHIPMVNALLGSRLNINSFDFGNGQVFSDEPSLITVGPSGWFFKIRCVTTLDNEGFRGTD